MVKIQDGLYHTEIGFPNITLPEGVFLLNYGTHARQEALRDRYGDISLPEFLTTSRASLFEIEVEQGCIIKGAWRTEYDDEHDITIVMKIVDRFVKTVWLNKKEDTHTTLDHTKYIAPH